MGEPGSEMLFQRMAHPVLDPWVHANRLGITLKSSKPVSATTRKRASSPRSKSSTGLKHSAKSGLGVRAKSSMVRFNPQPGTVEYVQNIVVPINAPADNQNIQQTINKQAFSSPRARTALPKMRPPTRGILTQNSNQDYAVSLPCVDDSVDSDASNKWNTSEQALRFEHEQEIRQKSAYLKKTQVFPHRVDRMYYMSGTTLGMRPRFHVEEEELQRLKRLAAERRSAKHYGRGISKYKYLGEGLDNLDLNNTNKLCDLSAGERLKQIAGRAVMKKILARMKEYMDNFYKEQQEQAFASEWYANYLRRQEALTPQRKFSFQFLPEENTLEDPLRERRLYTSADGKQNGVAYKLTSSFQDAPNNAPQRYYGNWYDPVECDCRTPGLLVCHQNLF